MPSAARLDDVIGHGVPTGSITGPCSGNVFTNGIPAARANVDLADCLLHPPVPLPIATGSSNVFINGKPAARLGDSITCSAIISTGSGNVFIGGGGGGGTVRTGPVMPEDDVSPVLLQALLVADVGAASLLTGKDIPAVHVNVDDSMNAVAANFRKLEPVRDADGNILIEAPSEAEVKAQLALHPHYFLKNFTETAAFNKGHIWVVRDDANKTVTLVGRGAVYGELGFIVAADAMNKWDKLSYTDADGYTYRSDVKFRYTKNKDEADVLLNYGVEIPKGGRQYAKANGQVFLLGSDLNGLEPGLGAHELGHAFFGVRDAYFNMRMPNGYIVENIPFAGFENSVMATNRGIVRGQDLKDLALKYEDSQRKYRVMKNKF